MIRLLLFFFVSLSLFSCEDVYTKDDELFYQISEADSARCMEEILTDMMEEAQNSQKEANDYHWGTCVNWGALLKEVLDIQVDSSGRISYSSSSSFKSIPNSVFDFFVHARFESDSILMQNMQLRSSRGYLIPQIYDSSEIPAWVNKEIDALKEVKETPGIDHNVVSFYKEKVDEVLFIQKVIERFKLKRVYVFSEFARVQIHANERPEMYQEVVEKVIQGYFSMRNYECIRLLGESYLSLHERAIRLKRPVDVEKLDLLKKYRPIRIIDINSNGRIQDYIPVVQVDV